MAGRLGDEEALHRAGLALGEWLASPSKTLCAWLSPAGTARDRTKPRPSGHHELISHFVWYKNSVRPLATHIRRLPLTIEYVMIKESGDWKLFRSRFALAPLDE